MSRSKKSLQDKILTHVRNYFLFFLLTAFIVTCCMSIFLCTLSDTMGIALTEDNISAAAKLTFGNVILLTFLFTLIDTIRRRLTVDRPVRQITQAAEQLMQGDFSVRIPELGGIGAEKILLTVIRISLLYAAHGIAPGEDRIREYYCCRLCGAALLFMDIALSVIAFYMVCQNRGFTYHSIATIAMAAYTFAAFTVAVVNVIRYRKYNSPSVGVQGAIRSLKGKFKPLCRYFRSPYVSVRVVQVPKRGLNLPLHDSPTSTAGISVLFKADD